jgi:hypothetical protein
VKLRTRQLPLEELAPKDPEELIRAKAQGKLDLRLLPSEPERAIIAQATSVNPANRFATCGEMVGALDRVLHP